jgi:hypothetical protein
MPGSSTEPSRPCGQGGELKTFGGWDLFILGTLGFPVSKKMGLDPQLH